MTANRRRYPKIVIRTLLVTLSIGFAVWILIRGLDRNTVNAGACGDRNITTPEDLPEDVNRFHQAWGHNSAADRHQTTVTWFPCPYPDYYFVLVFDVDGTVAHWNVIPDWAWQGGLEGRLSDDHQVFLQKLLARIAGEGKSAGFDGDFLVVMTFYSVGMWHSMVCGEWDCKPEVRSLFALADDAFHRTWREDRGLESSVDWNPFTSAEHE